jgi:hypothetical protein
MSSKLFFSCLLARWAEKSFANEVIRKRNKNKHALALGKAKFES